MTKTNVFDTAKTIKSNAEALLNKVKKLNVDVDSHLINVNSLWSVLDKKALQETLNAVDVKAVDEHSTGQFDETENTQISVLVPPESVVESVKAIELNPLADFNVVSGTEPASKVPLMPEAKPELSSTLKSWDKPNIEVSKKSDDEIKPLQKEADIKKIQIEGSATDAPTVKINPEFKGATTPRAFEPRPRPETKPDTFSATARPTPQQKDRPFVRPAQQGQASQQRSDSPRPFNRAKPDRRPVDIVDKFFSDPELKEREKKEKEEAIKTTAQRTPQTQSKTKLRQDKKAIWFDKEPSKAESGTWVRNSKNKGLARQIKQEPVRPTAERKKSITMGDFITVKDLSEKIGVQASEIIKSLLKLGVLVTINQDLDYDTAMLVSSEFNIELEKKSIKTYEQVMTDDDLQDSHEGLVSRPPIVTVMGHVDHGKTSLLDAIRNSRVTENEAGGITQHIGAYSVEMNNKLITFLDTPGHEAFTSMRARGAQVTDIAVLVVAADDGIMPQTIEAINHAKAAKVPIIVAINKIDLPDADPDRVAQQLMEHGLVAEKWGGETITVPVSALKRKGIDTLLEMIILVAELQELKANPHRLGKGTVIEAQLDKGRGPVATVLVQNGTLNIGDAIVAGKSYGRVRAMIDFRGKRLKHAGPSIPVEVLGLSDVPEAGDMIYAVKDDKLAKQVAEERESKSRNLLQKSLSKTSLEDLFNQVKEGDTKDLNIIIKADVQGSVEAVKNALERITTDKVRIKPIHGGVGAITESDVILATASNAIIVGFNVRPSGSASELAQKEKIEIRLYRIIYNAIEDIQAAIKGMLAPEYKEARVGQAEIRAVFKVTGMGNVAGCMVTDGKILRNAGVRLIRDSVVVHEGKISSLKRFKDDAKEVASGYECGISINNFNDIKEGDIIEAFVMEEIQTS